MSKDRRAETVETMARKLAALMIRDGQRFNTTEYAEAALDIAGKAFAAEVQRLANEWHKEWRAGHKANTHLEGKSDGADECVTALLALTSEGTKP